MRDNYQNLIIEILFIQQEDIVRTSPNSFDDVTPDPFTPKPFNPASDVYQKS